MIGWNMTAGDKQLIEAILESVGLERIPAPVGTYQDQYPLVGPDQQPQEDGHAQKMVERRRRLPDLSS